MTRLRICSILNAEHAIEDSTRWEMKFQSLKRRLGVSDATLSKQFSYLEKAGYVTRQRRYGANRSKDTVWITLTKAGQQAFLGHVEALREIAGEA